MTPEKHHSRSPGLGMTLLVGGVFLSTLILCLAILPIATCRYCLGNGKEWWPTPEIHILACERCKGRGKLTPLKNWTLPVKNSAR